MIMHRESAGQSTPRLHRDAFELGDEFAAAFEPRCGQFEICDNVAALIRVRLSEREVYPPATGDESVCSIEFARVPRDVVVQSIHSK